MTQQAQTKKTHWSHFPTQNTEFFIKVKAWPNVCKYLKEYTFYHSLYPVNIESPEESQSINFADDVPYIQHYTKEHKSLLKKFAPFRQDIQNLNEGDNALFIHGILIFDWPKKLFCLNHPFFKGLQDAYDLDLVFVPANRLFLDDEEFEFINFLINQSKSLEEDEQSDHLPVVETSASPRLPEDTEKLQALQQENNSLKQQLQEAQEIMQQLTDCPIKKNDNNGWENSTSILTLLTILIGEIYYLIAKLSNTKLALDSFDKNKNIRTAIPRLAHHLGAGNFDTLRKISPFRSSTQTDIALPQQDKELITKLLEQNGLSYLTEAIKVPRLVASYYKKDRANNTAAPDNQPKT